MTKHKQRLTTLGGYSALSPSPADRQAIDRLMADNPSLKKEYKKLAKKTMARCDAQLMNGSGLPMDRTIREFLMEYNSRLFEVGLTSMPSSFNVMESFMEFIGKDQYFRLCDEQDHMISFPDFFDFATSPDGIDSIDESASLLSEGVIYSFNAINDLGEMTFSISSDAEYAVGGVSMIRHGSEINVLLLAGEEADLDICSESIAVTGSGTPAPGKEMIAPNEERKREAVALNGDDRFWQFLIVARYDLDDMTQNARYVLKDSGDSFIVLTDDSTVFLDPNTGDFLRPEDEEFAKEIAGQVEQYVTLFELCKTCVSLPAYFERYGDVVSTERHPTILSEQFKAGKWISRGKLLSTKERVIFRNVHVLEETENYSPDNTFYQAPDFQVETSGYWKSIGLNEIGEDKSGNPIHGRTWVKKELTWVQKQVKPYIVRMAREKRRLMGSISEDLSDKGYIYVMHNPAHDVDVFKVGLTRRDPAIRSKELSKTGAPDKFLVAQQWNVGNCTKTEETIHKALDQFRMNPRREFFRLPYKDLLLVIEDVLQNL